MPDTLGRKTEAHMIVELTRQGELLKEMIRLDLTVVRRTSASSQLMAFQVQSTLMGVIREAEPEIYRPVRDLGTSGESGVF